jgi:hypothetical protein
MVLLGLFTADCHGVWLYAHVALIWQFANFPVLVDLPPIAMECGFMHMLCSSGNLQTFLFGVLHIWAIFFLENPLYRLKLYFSGRNLANFAKTKTLVWRIGYSRIG